MIIIINNKPAVLKKGASFDFISENHFFTGADSYTLSITFPLKGCQQNLDIFGHLNRKDFNLETLLLDCEIHDGAFHKYGSVSIVEISDTEVKTQFLEGKSARNFYSDLDKIYINEIDLGKIEEANHFSPAFYWKSIDDDDCPGWVALPWVNNTSGNLQNNVELGSNNTDWYWVGGNDEFDVSPQVYLLWLAKKIAEAVELKADFTPWENSEFRHLIVCNAFPYAWEYHDITAVLPHWSVTEFFEQLELLLNCDFDISQRDKTIIMNSNVNTLSTQQSYEIQNVVDSFTAEVEDDADETYLEQVNLQYEEDDHNMQKYYSCHWLIEQLRKSGRVLIWNSFSTMITMLKNYKTISGDYPSTSYVQNIHYASDIDTYFLMRCYSASYDRQGNVKTHLMKVIPINQFGPRVCNDDEDADYTELGIVPAWIDDVNSGKAIFLECGSYGESDSDDDDTVAQPFAMKVLANGEEDEKEEYFSKIYVAFWDGVLRHGTYLPHPMTDKIEIDNAWNRISCSYSLRLSSSQISSMKKTSHYIDQEVKYTFTFISDTMPDVQSIFFIHGKKFLCEKITATFSAETGMSQKMKGVFYRIL